MTAMVVVGVATSQIEDWSATLTFAALFVLCDSLPVLSGSNTRYTITVTQPVAIAAFVVLGPWGAAFVAASVLFDLVRLSPIKRMFNASQLALSAFLGGLTYQVVGGGAVIETNDFPGILVPILAGGLVYSVANVALVGYVLRLVEGVPLRTPFSDMNRKMAFPTVAYSSLGLLIAVLWQDVGPLALVLVLVPLFVARWAMAQYAAERDAYQATIRTLVQAVETKDAYTRGHSERVARASVMIARQIGMGEDRVNMVEYAGTLHDVGKLGVPTTVLQKAGKLTDDEYDAIKTHPVRGHEIVRDIEFLDEALAGIYHHHERMDGRGYPAGLSGHQIPEFGRVIAVADAFDSMTSTRSYRGARPIPEAIAELERCKNSQFDPDMVDALIVAVAEAGWTPATPPSADEIAAQTSFSIDDDDPFVDVSRQVRP
jgi:hypothetical protein